MVVLLLLSVLLPLCCVDELMLLILLFVKLLTAAQAELGVLVITTGIGSFTISMMSIAAVAIAALQ